MGFVRPFVNHTAGYLLLVAIVKFDCSVSWPLIWSRFLRPVFVVRQSKTSSTNIFWISNCATQHFFKFWGEFFFVSSNLLTILNGKPRILLQNCVPDRKNRIDLSWICEKIEINIQNRFLFEQQLKRDGRDGRDRKDRGDRWESRNCIDYSTSLSVYTSQSFARTARLTKVYL